MRAPRATLAFVERAHIAYWLVGALWPLVSMRSFERVTGNKRDEWLVRTVSLLMLSVVATLAALARSRRDESALRLLGGTSAAALGSVALAGPLLGRISPVYLVDATVDTALAALWALAPGTGSAANERVEGDSERQSLMPDESGGVPEPTRREDR